MSPPIGGGGYLWGGGIKILESGLVRWVSSGVFPPLLAAILYGSVILLNNPCP